MPNPYITKVYFLNVPLENDYRNTLYFPDNTTQQQYFQQRVKVSYTDFSYQRKDSYIRVPAQYDELLAKGVNYVMYQNTAYSNKWFYAFITHLEYKDDGRTDVYIETDVMQTWRDEMIVKASYVEREHCDDDTPGINTQPEDLETGEYITAGFETSLTLLDDTKIIIASTVDATKTPSKQGSDEAETYPSAGACVHGGVFSGVRYFIMDDPEDAQIFINNLTRTGQDGAIQSIFMFPTKFLTEDDGAQIQTWTTKSWYWSDQYNQACYDDGAYLHPPETVGEYNPITEEHYTPNNKKLLTYPYCYLMATNNNGAEAIYRYEFFTFADAEKTIDFKIDGVVTPGGSIRMTPLRYAGEPENYLRGITGAKLPVCSWVSDVYTNWLTQQGMNLSIAHDRAKLNLRSANYDMSAATSSAVFDAIEMAAGLATASMGGAAGTAGLSASTGVARSFTGNLINMGKADVSRENAYLDIKSVAAQKYEHSMIPPQASGNLNSGDVNYAMGLCSFTIRQMTIREEYARIIDKFFDMYGYATNLVKEPLSHHRKYYWFTKTVGVNIDGAIPNADMNTIKQCYNNGITFWRYDIGDHNIGNYNLVNTIERRA